MKRAAQKPETRTIPAGEFKAKCLQLMDEVKEKKLHLIVTKRGQPVVEIGPPPEQEKPFRSIVGRSPGIKVPSWAEWPELKKVLAGQWSDPGEKLARIEASRPPVKRRRA